MGRGLWVDVVKRKNRLILIQNIGRNLSSDNLSKYCVAQTNSFLRVSYPLSILSYNLKMKKLIVPLGLLLLFSLYWFTPLRSYIITTHPLKFIF